MAKFVTVNTTARDVLRAAIVLVRWRNADPFMRGLLSGRVGISYTTLVVDSGVNGRMGIAANPPVES